MESILVVGILRNSSKTIQKEIENIARAFSDFRVSYFFVESDSQDNTVEKLNFLKSEIPGFNYISLGNLESKIPNRISRIAFCRNVYLDELHNRRHTLITEFTVVADMDGVNKKLTKSGVESCFNLEGWAVCAANQRGPYYDIYALRAENWNTMNLPDSYQFYLNRYVFHAAAFYSSVIRKMFRHRGRDPIAVDSAFGGIAIYRTSFLKKSSYISSNVNGDDECEHVGLHNVIRKEGGQIVINPGFINSGWTRNSLRAVLKFCGILLLGRRYYYFKKMGF